MSNVYFIVIPIVVVVVILKLCLIFWRIWLYQKRRERVVLVQGQGTTQRHIVAQEAQRPTARVVQVQRSVGPEGFTQRTSYAISQPGLPTRQVTRTIVVRPSDNRRPNDPNLPPSYDQAVTGKDKSVKVEEPPKTQTNLPPPPGTGATAVPNYDSNLPPTAPPPPPPFQDEGVYQAPYGTADLLPPPAYSSYPPPPPPSAPVIDSQDDSAEVDDTRPLLA